MHKQVVSGTRMKRTMVVDYCSHWSSQTLTCSRCFAVVLARCKQSKNQSFVAFRQRTLIYNVHCRNYLLKSCCKYTRPLSQVASSNLFTPTFGRCHSHQATQETLSRDNFSEYYVKQYCWWI